MRLVEKEMLPEYSDIRESVTFIKLPPYSPDLNPIEMLWSKIKAILRSLEVRINEALPDAIASAFQRVSTTDCIGWFNAVGLLD